MEDAPYLAKHLNDSEVTDNLASVPFPYGLKDANHWLKGAVAVWRKKRPGKLNFIIEIDGEPAGSIGLDYIEENHKAEIGYWLAKNHWGRGIMSEVLKEITKFGFGELDLKRITAKVFAGNPASKKVLEKNGFTEEGFLRKEAKKEGKYHDAYLMAKIKH